MCIQEGLEDMWDALLGREDVGVTPTESAVVLVEPPKIVRQDREMILRLLFEEFGFKAVYLANSAVLSGYANNMTSGTVVSLGGEHQSWSTFF